MLDLIKKKPFGHKISCWKNFHHLKAFVKAKKNNDGKKNQLSNKLR